MEQGQGEQKAARTILEAVPLAAAVTAGSLVLSRINTPEGCIGADDKSLEVTQNAVAAPEAEAIEGVYTHAHLKELATEHGLTIMDPSPYQEGLDVADTNQKVMDTLSNYLSNFSIQVSVPSQSAAEDEQIPIGEWQDLDDVELADLKHFSETIFALFSFIPTEVTKFAELEHIKLVRSINFDENQIHRPGETVSGMTNRITRIFYVSMKSVEEDDIYYGTGYALIDVLTHEFSHLLDAKLCKSRLYVQDDPSFESPNPKNFHYGSENNYEKNIELNRFQTAYGTNSVLEDKAEYYKLILNGSFPRNGESKVTVDKFIELVARLEQHIPGVLGYYSQLWRKSE